MRDTFDTEFGSDWSHVVHLARLGLNGQQADIQRYLRKILPSAPRPVADALTKYAELQILPRSNSNSVSAPKPVDTDSRLELLKVDEAPAPDRILFYSAKVVGALNDFIEERLLSSELQAAGLRPPKSVIFAGPPGVGKTKGAQLVASKLMLPLYTLDLSAVMSSFLGKTGQNVRQVLDYAKNTPCVLLLDEFDSIAKRRDASDDSGELRRLVNVLLLEIDSWPESGVLIAATNFPELLDPAVWRRFDSTILFEKPDVASVIALLRDRISSPLGLSFYEALARCLVGKSHSEIENIVAKAQRNVVLRGTPIQESLIRALHDASSIMTNEEKRHLSIELSRLEYPHRDIAELVNSNKSTVNRWINGSRK